MARLSIQQQADLYCEYKLHNSTVQTAFGYFHNHSLQIEK